MQLSSWVNSLVWTLMHSLWHGVLAAALAAIIISLTKRSTARLRYNLLGMVVILFLVATGFTFYMQFPAGTIPTSNIVPESAASVTPILLNEPGSMKGKITDLINDNAQFLFLAWIVFFSLHLVKLLAGLRSTHILPRKHTRIVSEKWLARLEELKHDLGIRRSVQFLESKLVKVPVALGFLKPVILVPAGILSNLPPEQVEVILLHELGHIRRNDFMINFLQRMMESIFFFNPGLRWVSSLIREEREACCDEIVVNTTRQDRKYVEALVVFQEYAINHHNMVMGIVSKKYPLLARMKRILTKENKQVNLFETSVLLAGLVLFSAFGLLKDKEIKPAQPVPIVETASVTVTEFDRGQIVNKITGGKLPRQENPVIIKSARASRPALLASPGINRVIADTISPNKAPAIAKKKTQEKPLPWHEEEQRIKKNLDEIQKVKDDIGADKEYIGSLKAKLVNSDKKTQDEVNIEINKKRKEIETKRASLDSYRAKIESDRRKIIDKRADYQAKKMETEREKKNKDDNDDD